MFFFTINIISFPLVGLIKEHILYLFFYHQHIFYTVYHICVISLYACIVVNSTHKWAGQLNDNNECYIIVCIAAVWSIVWFNTHFSLNNITGYKITLLILSLKWYSKTALALSYAEVEGDLKENARKGQTDHIPAQLLILNTHKDSNTQENYVSWYSSICFFTLTAQQLTQCKPQNTIWWDESSIRRSVWNLSTIVLHATIVLVIRGIIVKRSFLFLLGTL